MTAKEIALWLLDDRFIKIDMEKQLYKFLLLILTTY